ncbi:hypothetical protein [Pinibacter soli]|uniref:Uncharacterized protein n=1 Tax=Pinibacter soli TaxID=3044211 RepID=A0ABT6RDJ8_9BACT|nr:hypothetical protein [Pinibacter soli]MDI3320637.1 hypothetical protein [Pinibacter soli]
MPRGIGSFKTKHSNGHYIGFGAGIGAASGAILGGIGGAASGGSETVVSPAETAAIFAALGLAGGAIIGGITAAAKNSKQFVINGDTTNWKTFLSMVISYNAALKMEWENPVPSHG